jgi:hypothetical protein
MPFPTGWPPRTPSGIKNIRFFVEDTATANFNDQAYLFADQAAANPYTPLPFVRPGEGVSKPGYTGPHVVPTNPAGTGQLDKDAPHPMIWSEHILVVNLDLVIDLEISFDGSTVHAVIPANSERKFSDRREAGIAIRGNGADFRIEAW